MSRCQSVGVVLIVHEQGASTYFDSSDSFLLAVAVYFLERVKRDLFIAQDAVVVDLVSRLLQVKLVLEHVYLVVEGLKLVEKGALGNGGIL